MKDKNDIDIKITYEKDSTLKLYQKREEEMFWTATDGTKMDLQGVIIE